MPPKSLRQTILDCDDTQTELVSVPEWSVDILVQGMTGETRAAMLERSMNEDGEMSFASLYPEILIASCRDPETHDLLFVPGDVPSLNQKSGGVLERLARKAMKLSGLDSEAETKAGKSSTSIQSAGSTSS